MCDLLLAFITFSLLRAVCVYEKDFIRRMNWMCCATIPKEKKFYFATMNVLCCWLHDFCPYEGFKAMTENNIKPGIINCVMLSFDFWFKQNVISFYVSWCGIRNYFLWIWFLTDLWAANKETTVWKSLGAYQKQF
jgi:hypothetical protein